MVEPALRSVADVVFVFDVARGAPDPDVMKLARSGKRVLITEDYDFGGQHERDTKFAAEIAHLLQVAPGRFVIFSRYLLRSRPFPP
jgi:predicted nuclease of predicted toxin-antitoxin system